MDCCAIHVAQAMSHMREAKQKVKGIEFPCGAWGKAPHKAPHVLFPPYITNPSPRASMTIRLTAMETEFVKLASAVSLWQRSV